MGQGMEHCIYGVVDLVCIDSGKVVIFAFLSSAMLSTLLASNLMQIRHAHIIYHDVLSCDSTPRAWPPLSSAVTRVLKPACVRSDSKSGALRAPGLA